VKDKPECFTKWGEKGTDEEICSLCEYESPCYHAAHDDIVIEAVCDNAEQFDCKR
jgi:hypothetical protein